MFLQICIYKHSIVFAGKPGMVRSPTFSLGYKRKSVGEPDNIIQTYVEVRPIIGIDNIPIV